MAPDIFMEIEVAWHQMGTSNSCIVSRNFQTSSQLSRQMGCLLFTPPILPLDVGTFPCVDPRASQCQPGYARPYLGQTWAGGGDQQHPLCQLRKLTRRSSCLSLSLNLKLSAVRLGPQGRLFSMPGKAVDSDSPCNQGWHPLLVMPSEARADF